MRHTIIAFALTAALGTPTAEPASRICLDGKGDLTVRAKCGGSRMALNLATLAEMLPKSPAGFGLDANSCRTVKDTDSASAIDAAQTIALAQIECQPNEVLLNYGWGTDPIILSVARFEEVLYRGTVPVGVRIAAGWDTGAALANFYAPFTLHVSGTCCPKV